MVKITKDNLERHTMMNEASKKLLELYVGNLRKAVELVDRVIPVVRTFDGKIYNARLQNKMNEALEAEGVTVRVREFDTAHCEIDFCFYRNREIYVDEYYAFDKPGVDKKHRQVHYLPDGYEDVHVCNIWSDYSTWNTERKEKYHARNDSYFWLDENYKMRINAEAIIQDMQEKQETLEKDADDLAYWIVTPEGFSESKVEAVTEKVKALQKEAEELNGAIPSEIRELFGIKSWATWH